MKNDYIEAEKKTPKHKNIKQPKISLLRINDVALMDAICSHKENSSYEINIANKCRLYLNVFSLADITSGDGKQIMTSSWCGFRDCNHNRRDMKWPNWHKPPSSHWRIWKTVLSRTFCRFKQKHLDRPLKEWLEIRDTWRWFETDDDVLLEK